jgi:1-pyrroline-5-carboxylate dehydrogenase
MFTAFRNEPLVNFSEEGPRRKMQEALSRVEQELGQSHRLVIGGERVETAAKRVSQNPARPNQTVGVMSEADRNLAEQAVAVATRAFRGWSTTAPEIRARYLVKSAAIMRRRIYEFAAWMVYEASKSWPEAYADACEAVDFLEFYAREAVRWGQSHQTTSYPGEENEVLYVPLGVGAVIAPWNFPLAILCGMTSAAIAAGNTVVVKPASQTPIIASKLFEVFEMASLPAGVANLIPGSGQTLGEALTGHNGIRFVSFTGSKEVGLQINQRIAVHRPGQKWIKRAVLEMGGKNAIIVDDDVNPEIAALDACTSAFGYQGQKCSACSRLIVHTNIYDSVVAKVVERAKRLTVGDPVDGSNYMGAVIGLDAYRTIRSYMDVGRDEGKLLLGGEAPAEPAPGAGFFLPPTIFADVAPGARIEQEEIFGPVLSIIRAESFDQALDIANDTEFGLTGSVISNNRFHLEQARREFHVGNLYFNRKCTGALVGVQPFGGFNMSGTDSKAGGPDYLGLFLQAKSIAELY